MGNFVCFGLWRREGERERESGSEGKIERRRWKGKRKARRKSSKSVSNVPESAMRFSGRALIILFLIKSI